MNKILNRFFFLDFFFILEKKWAKSIPEQTLIFIENAENNKKLFKSMEK